MCVRRSRYLGSAVVAAAPGYPDIASALVRNDYDEVIRGVREAVTADGVAALSELTQQLDHP